MKPLLLINSIKLSTKACVLCSALKAILCIVLSNESLSSLWDSDITVHNGVLFLHVRFGWKVLGLIQLPSKAFKTRIKSAYNNLLFYQGTVELCIGAG